MPRYVPPPQQHAHEPPTPFARHAAKISLYVSMAAMLIGCLSRSSNHATVLVTLRALNLLLIAAGLYMGLFALASVKRLGPERLRAAAIGGIVLNLVALLFILGLIAIERSPTTIRRQLAGRWQITSAASGTVKQFDLALDSDGTFNATTARNDGSAATFSGAWKLSDNRLLILSIQNVVGAEGSMRGREMGLGIVKSIDAKQMMLSTSDGDETYQRVR